MEQTDPIDARCCFCGPVKNCGIYLPTVLKNIETLANVFNDYEIVIFYDHSNDNSLNILKSYQQLNPKLKIYVNRYPVSPFRTHRLAHARNTCLNYVRDMDFKYFAMMDFDDVNCKKVNINVLKKHLKEENVHKWDSLSFMTCPSYYDIWALSLHPFCFSYNHFKYSKFNNYTLIQKYVEHKLKLLNDGELLSCISAFNGFAIYKTEAFKDSKYDGNVRFDLLSLQQLSAHILQSKSKIVYRDYGHIKGKYEDCEHRAFHIDASRKNGAKIMISSDTLFI